MSGTTIETGKTGRMNRRALVRELLRGRESAPGAASS